MIVTIRVEYEGHRIRDDLGIQERLTTEQIDSAKFDIVCATLKNLRRMIDQALQEQERVKSVAKIREQKAGQ